MRVEEFEGPHPAGLVGTHIHLLEPVHDIKTVWHIGYADVAAIGHLFRTGRLDVTRVIALAGPMVERPRLVRTRIGASTGELTSGQLKDGAARVLSGSVLDGRIADGAHGYLGRLHRQVSALDDAPPRPLFGWMVPGFDRFSVTRTFASALRRASRAFRFTTSAQGDPRAIVPLGSYEKVLPLDLVPTPLLQSIMVGNTERCRMLGALELDEEDLALCSFVCPSKSEFGPHLREVLTLIEQEG